MKIICVGYFHGAGGAEKQIIKLANELSMRGQIVTVIALSECKIQYEINRQVRKSKRACCRDYRESKSRRARDSRRKGRYSL